MKALLHILVTGFAISFATMCAAQEQPGAGESVRVTLGLQDDPQGGLEVGKWMIAADGKPSDWLGEIYHGKNFREPINVIIVDGGAKDADDARKRLIKGAAEAGYPVRFGHSTGYKGLIGGQLYPQLPQGRDDAFSNEVFELSNNHGRIFGPHKMGGVYVFTGAFSREVVAPFSSPKHRYGSFNQARDDFTQNLNFKSPYKVVRFVDLGNSLIGEPKLTTGDHDGIAVLVQAQ